MSTRGFIGYRHKGEIFGWYNHSDSYPSSLGKDILEASLPYTQKEVQHFFLTRIKFVEGLEANKLSKTNGLSNSRSLCEIDRTKGTQLVYARDREFYKDGIFCEYSYIFDLDAKEKTLLLFTGFGEKPSKGYEDWYEKSSGPGKKLFYMQDCGAITDSLVKSLESILPDRPGKDLAYGAMEVLMDNLNSKVLLPILLNPKTDPNLYVGVINKLSGDEDISAQTKNLFQALLETRLKNPTMATTHPRSKK
jgi:hypothetical protein